MNPVVQTLDQHYYVIKLLGYDYTINYKPGKSNVVADALSRCDEPTLAFYLVIANLYFIPTLLFENNNFWIYRNYIRKFKTQPSLNLL